MHGTISKAGLRLKTPRYVKKGRDRTGRARFYYRRDKQSPRYPLPGLPYSPEFMAAYDQHHAANAAQAAPPKPVILMGTAPVHTGSLNQAITEYLVSNNFGQMAAATQDYRRRM